MAPALYLEGITVRGPSSFLPYFLIIIIINVIIIVICCLACPSLIVTQPGGRDGFLFRPSRMPFLSVARLWSPFATASGSVALAVFFVILFFLHILILCLRLLYPRIHYIHVMRRLTTVEDSGMVLTSWLSFGS